VVIVPPGSVPTFCLFVIALALLVPLLVLPVDRLLSNRRGVRKPTSPQVG